VCKNQHKYCFGALGFNSIFVKEKTSIFDVAFCSVKLELIYLLSGLADRFYVNVLTETELIQETM